MKQTTTMLYKGKNFFSELKTFFLKNNDNGDTIFSKSRILDGIHIMTGCLGNEKRHIRCSDATGTYSTR